MSEPENPMAWMSDFKVAELVQGGAKASALMEECTDVKASEGSVSLRGIFIGKLPKATRAADAPEGKKDAPDKYRIKLVGVKEFIARYQRDNAAAMAEIEGEEGAPVENITVIDESTFSLKAYQSVKKEDAMRILTKGADPMDKPKVEALLHSAKNDGKKNVYIPRGDYVIKDNGTIIVACFNPRASKLIPGCLVEVMGTDANAYWGTKSEQWQTGLNVQSIIVSPDNHENPVENFKAYGMLNNTGLPIFDASDTSSETHIVYFHTTVEKPDFEVAGNFSRLNNSKDPDRYAYKNKVGKEMQKLQLSMYLRSWDDRGMQHGYDQTIQTTVFQWKKDDKQDNRLVLKFGIPDVGDFKKFMSVNPIPVVCSSTVDQKETAALPDPRAGLVLKTWEYFPNLQEYLLEFCPRISWEYMLSKLGSKRTPGRIEMNDSNNPNLLNIEAGEKQGSDWIMTGSVIALSSWEGYVIDVEQAGCEVRALIDADIPLAERLKFKDMSIEDAMKVIRCEPDALIKLEKIPNLYFYAVKPKHDNGATTAMDIDDEEEEEEAPKKTQAPKKTKVVEDDEDVEEEDEDEDEPSPKRKVTSHKETGKKKAKVVRKVKGKK